MVNNHNFWSQVAWIQILLQLHTNCLALANYKHLYLSCFVHKTRKYHYLTIKD